MYYYIKRQKRNWLFNRRYAHKLENYYTISTNEFCLVYRFFMGGRVFA